MMRMPWEPVTSSVPLIETIVTGISALRRRSTVVSASTSSQPFARKIAVFLSIRAS